MTKGNGSLKGNNRFQGYCIDLINEISRMYGFRYKISLVKDNMYGSRKTMGEWNGMIRQLIDKEADLAVADLTINYEREEVVDFTTPFMIFGISILLKHPSKDTPHLFTFLSPLSLEVWVAVAAAYLCVTMILYGVAHFTPFEWMRKRRSDPKRLVLENQFNLSASFWFTAGSFTQQGSHMMPRATSTRILATIWWFFTLIILSSYTANLAAFITVQRMISPIITVEDLEKQSNIRYGCVGDGATAEFFKMSDVAIYQRIWTTMESSQPSVFFRSNEEGVKRVLNEKYAFFMESPAIEYVTRRHCNLLQTGGLLDTKGYGFATPPGSQYLQLFSSAILKLQEKGVLEALKQKWWNDGSTASCPQLSSTHLLRPVELNIHRLGGLFIVLSAGIGVACVVVVIEYFCNKETTKRTSKTVRFAESHL